MKCHPPPSIPFHHPAAGHPAPRLSLASQAPPLAATAQPPPASNPAAVVSGTILLQAPVLDKDGDRFLLQMRCRRPTERASERGQTLPPNSPSSECEHGGRGVRQRQLDQQLPGRHPRRGESRLERGWGWRRRRRRRRGRPPLAPPSRARPLLPGPVLRRGGHHRLGRDRPLQDVVPRERDAQPAGEEHAAGEHDLEDLEPRQEEEGGDGEEVLCRVHRSGSRCVRGVERLPEASEQLLGQQLPRL